MNLPLWIATYILCWWLVFFTILPIGIRTQAEAGEISPGTAESAPVQPRLLARLLATTLISGLIFGILYTLSKYGMLSLDSIPFLPKFDSYLQG